MNALTAAVAGLIVLGLCETVIVAILLKDRKIARAQYIKQAEEFLLALDKRDEILRIIGDRMSDLHGEIKQLAGTLVGVARLVLDREIKTKDDGTKSPS